MKQISLYLPESAYQEMKSLAEQQERPVAELIRQAMMDYLERERKANRSIMDRTPHRSGTLLKGWTRSDILEEMLES